VKQEGIAGSSCGPLEVLCYLLAPLMAYTSLKVKMKVKKYKNNRDMKTNQIIYNNIIFILQIKTR
jgi:hypothetical protein